MGNWLGFARREMVRRNLHALMQGPFDITSRLTETSYADDGVITQCLEDALSEAKADCDKLKENLKQINEFENKKS